MADPVTIKDIARLAGVSIGTVDRVLHNRGRVADSTAKRIRKIISDTEFKPNLHASNLAQTKNYTIGVLTPLPEQDSGFWRLPHDGMRRAAKALAPFSVQLFFHCYDRFSEASFREAAAQLLKDSPDGILLAPVLPGAAENFVRTLPETVRLCCFDSDLPDSRKVAFIGQDSYVSGKLAAKLMKMLVPPGKKPAIIQAVNMDYHIRGRVNGFRESYAKETVPPVFEEEHLDTPETCAAFMDSLLKKMPDVGGIFVTNASIHMISAYLSEKGRSDIALIGYDLIPENRKYLEQGVIDFLISQRPGTQGYMGIQTLFRALSGQIIEEPRMIMPIDILTEENVQYYTILDTIDSTKNDF